MRKIIHVDMDAYFASVEQRDEPNLKGKPIAVGGRPDRRGVIATASYEARRYGVRSAISSKKALELCPQLIIVPGRMKVYRTISYQIRDLFKEYTELVQPLSLDEAFLDVTSYCHQQNLYASQVASEIQSRIWHQHQLTCSVGVAANKFLAKLGSDWNKPNGIKVFLPEEAEALIQDLPVRKLWGVGPVGETKMHQNGLLTFTDVRQAGVQKMAEIFGKAGVDYWNLAWGRDDRPVKLETRRKSLSTETTLYSDTNDLDEVWVLLQEMLVELYEQMTQRGWQAYQLGVKVTYADFVGSTRSISLPYGLIPQEQLSALMKKLLLKTDFPRRSIRLIGLFFGDLRYPDDPVQLYIPFSE